MALLPMLKRLPLAVVLLAGGGLVFLAVRLGEFRFSPDSWAYFELAKTVFGGEFYQFNTYRSYFSATHSASFPLGYPVAIAVAQAVFGVHPMVGVAINIAAAVGTALLIVAIGRRSKLPEPAQAALVLSLFCYPAYLDEVLFGRSTPLAILCFVAAFRCLLAARYFATGLLLGAAALVRFDFLVFGLLFLAAMPMLGRQRPAEMAVAGSGFLLGIAPWVAYSLAYFGQPWISDNSWIAWSAAPAYVADYPAVAARNAFNAPGEWLLRIISNLPTLFKYLLSWSFDYPLAVIAGLFAAASWAARRCPLDKKTLLVFGLLLASLFPYLLTRYFDNRYFALLFLCLCFFLLTRLRDQRLMVLNLPRLALLSMVPTTIVAAHLVAGYFELAALATERSPLEQSFIASLHACQQASPGVRYIFTGEAYRLAPRYGATTGGLAAFIPSNFQRMSESDRQDYLEKMRPYVLIDKITETYPCRR